MEYTTRCKTCRREVVQNGAGRPKLRCEECQAARRREQQRRYRDNSPAGRCLICNKATKKGSELCHACRHMNDDAAATQEEEALTEPTGMFVDDNTGELLKPDGNGGFTREPAPRNLSMKYYFGPMKTKGAKAGLLPVLRVMARSR